jgi:homoserine kinase type II
MDAWRARYSALADKLEHSFSSLEREFFPVHEQLPAAFCHGDYHPLNMVWGTDGIRSVIDWEFCGIKPELYDAALLVGCIGFEDPDNLIKEPVIRLVRRLRAAGYGADRSWDCFLQLTAAIRFGWMSEWIRRHDREARRMESVYIDILVDQAAYIQQKW